MCFLRLQMHCIKKKVSAGIITTQEIIKTNDSKIKHSFMQHYKHTTSILRYSVNHQNGLGACSWVLHTNIREYDLFTTHWRLPDNGGSGLSWVFCRNISGILRSQHSCTKWAPLSAACSDSQPLFPTIPTRHLHSH